jgi:hypothetical protein
MIYLGREAGARTAHMAVTIDRRRQELLQILREAGKQPLTYRDLEAFGIQQPANLIYELELIGQPVERVYRNRASGTKALIGFRLKADEQTVPNPARRSRSAVIRNR